MREEFDFDVALAALQGDQGLTGYLGVGGHIAEIYHCPTGDCKAICR